MGDERDRVAMVSDLTEMKTELRGEIGSLAQRLEASIKATAEKTRRHFDVVAEHLRSDFRVVIDKTVATGEKVDRLIARNAAEHAAFVEAITDHQVRLRILEAARDDSA